MSRGYLLIELMITIMLVMISSIILGHLQGQMMQYHRHADYQLRAVLIADQILQHHSVPSLPAHILATLKKYRSFPQIPYYSCDVHIIFKEGKQEYCYDFQGGFFKPDA